MIKKMQSVSEISLGRGFKFQVEDFLKTSLPKEQYDRVMNQYYIDIDPEFMEFLDAYYALSRLIPWHFTVIDIGCSYNPQAFLFENHKKLISIDLNLEIKEGYKTERFQGKNNEIYEMNGIDFIDQHIE